VFFGFRIYFSSTILYYFLVLPFLLILTIKYAPRLREFGKFNTSGEEENVTFRLDSSATSLITDTLKKKLPAGVAKADSAAHSDTSNLSLSIGPVGVTVRPENSQSDEDSQIGKAFTLLINLLLISFILGLVFNLPFKRYFRRKRKNKPISPRLFKFCKRFLLLSPLINAGILFLAYGIMHGYMLFTMFTGSAFAIGLERELYRQFFYVSLVASLLSLLFVYFWEKSRVHIKYIEHIYSEEELKKRIFGLKVGRIRNRLWISSAMTTLLPLTIVILYLFLSLTHMKDFESMEFTDDQKKILFGDYLMFSDIFSGDDLRIPGWLFYVNVVNSFFMFLGIYSGILIAFIYILLFVKWTTQDIVEPVRELLESMKRTGEGEMNQFTVVRTNDEIGELSEGYNEMSQKLTDHINSISRMNEAYLRFVPKQFLDYLGKESFVDIRLGDQVEKEMTVMFSDIRSFTDISERMTPKENFDFINHYLGYMEPVIRNNNGFIDKYMGDSIMALFSERVEDALTAAVEMRYKLSQFNQIMSQLGKPVINSGIGIHSGQLMLGVVGGEGRYDGTVISDAVNLASRLENLTKLYGSSIIISQDTLIRLEYPQRYNYRFLDTAKVKGKQEVVYIFEIIDGEPDDIRQLKISTKESFARGINLYREKQFGEAGKTFREVLEANPHDQAAGLYIQRCQHFIQHGVPTDWDGIETFRQKQ